MRNKTIKKLSNLDNVTQKPVAYPQAAAFHLDNQNTAWDMS